MAEKKMTQREIYQHIMDALPEDAEVVEFCQKKIDQLDHRKTTPRKPNQEVVERRQAVYDFLSNADSAYTVGDLSAALGYTSPQITGAMRGLINEGRIEVIEPEQKSKPKMYRALG